MRVSAVIWTPKSRRDKAPRKTRTGTECWKTPNILIAITTCVEKLTTENLTPAPQLLPIKYSGYSPERKVPHRVTSPFLAPRPSRHHDHRHRLHDRSVPVSPSAPSPPPRLPSLTYWLRTHTSSPSRQATTPLARVARRPTRGGAPVGGARRGPR